MQSTNTDILSIPNSLASSARSDLLSSYPPSPPLPLTVSPIWESVQLAPKLSDSSRFQELGYGKTKSLPSVQTVFPSHRHSLGIIQEVASNPVSVVFTSTRILLQQRRRAFVFSSEPFGNFCEIKPNVR